MSSMIFSTDEERILVATDTLAVTPSGEPFMFAMKATHVPHLRTIIAGTGGAGFANKWALRASSRMIVNGIHNLDYHTPNGLRELWKKYSLEYSLSEDFTTTVYQFGISEINDKVVSFAYRSTNDFESEQLQYGTAVKPKCRVPEGNLIELIPSMMEEQRDIQENLPKESRLYIGGEIYALCLTAEGCNSFKLGQFKDYETHKRKIFENHRKEKR